MPAVLDALPVESAIVSAPPAKVRDYSHLRAYQFKPGQHVQGRGRPKGSKNAATILERAAPKIAQHFIRRAFQSDPVLIDAMKRVLPIEQESSPDEGRAFQIVFAALPIDQSATPRPVAPAYFTEPILSDLPVLGNPQRELQPVGSAEPTTLLKSQPTEAGEEALGHA